MTSPATRRSATPLFLVAAATLAPVASLAQEAPLPSSPLVEPWLAWDRGDYVEALEGYLALLEGPDGEGHAEEIARLTGEVFHVTEVVADGGEVRWGPDGRHFLLEVDRGGRTVTEVFQVAEGAPRRLATLEGRGAALSAGARVAYLAGAGRPTLWVGELGSEAHEEVDLGGLVPQEVAFPPDGEALFMLSAPTQPFGENGIFVLRPTELRPEPVEGAPGWKRGLQAAAGGRYAVHEVWVPDPDDPQGRRGPVPAQVAVADLEGGPSRAFWGVAPALSRDGAALAFVGPGERAANAVRVVRLDPGDGEAEAAAVEADPPPDPEEPLPERTPVAGLVEEGGPEPVEAVPSNRPLGAPALSADAALVAYQHRLHDDWEVFVAPSHGEGEPVRLTREIQHDVLPAFVDESTVLALKGEPRHRRSYLYDLETGRETRLFHNNTVRTVAPEYEWAPSPDGTRILVVADRDGDTVTPGSAVYLVDRTQQVTREQVATRLRLNLRLERDLRERGTRMYAPLADAVRAATTEVSPERVHLYADQLFRFDSKHILAPGNLRAAEYLFETLRAFGYEPEYQWFEPQPGVRTANVLATLPGTENPELVYVASSHFDSTLRGPGADDNTSGTTALLEAARVLSTRPQAATLQFAFFTAEEAGLRGSREFVRRAQAEGVQVVGALNNDMVGWTRSHRLDNTIRYSNSGIRDVQHAAAIQFSALITYDARYHRGTDAAALYEAYGDVIGGIGSYPILGSPHYHQPTDHVATIDHRLVAEVSRTTVASLILLASSPSRLTGLRVSRRGGAVEAAWVAAREAGVARYVVRYGPPAPEPDGDLSGPLLRVQGPDPERTRTATVAEPRATLEEAEAGWIVEVKAVGRRGLEGWDWARATVPP